MLFRFVALSVLIIVAVLPISGCTRSKEVVLGQAAPAGSLSTVTSARELKSPGPVMLSGVIIDKCPVAGCWFHLRDQTGVMKVDTKAARFTVTEVPLQTRVTVTGKVVRDGSETMLEATGLRY